METTNLIIGAGLAGSTCAHQLARAGQRVLMVDACDLSRKEKLCAGLLTPRALRELACIYGMPAQTVISERFTSMHTLAGRHDVAIEPVTMACTDRKALDALCLNAALAAGAQVRDRFKIRDIDTRNKTVSGTVQGEGLAEISYEHLIVADGALSPTRKLLTGASPDAVLALETRVERNATPLTFAYLDGFFGYFWYAPCADHAKIGCGSYGGDELREPLERFARACGVELGKVRGAYIPTGKDVLLRTDAAYFLGDAASLVCPPSGEGIYFALHSGRMCAKAILAHASYEALMRPCALQVKRQFKTRRVFFNATFIDKSLEAAGHTPYGKQRAIQFALKNFASFS